MNPMDPAQLCATAQAHIDEFIDNELGPAACDGIASHLLTCATCRRAYEQELALKMLVQRKCGCDAVPDDVRARVQMSISRIRLEADGFGIEQTTLRAQIRRD